MKAEEFLLKENLPTDILSGDDISYAMIEFAKLHVKAALEAVHSNMQLPEEDLEFTLDAYPETNIK